MRRKTYVGLQAAHMDLSTLRNDAMGQLGVEKQQWIGGSRINVEDLRILYYRRDQRRARARYLV
jgi:hypothetical protein